MINLISMTFLYGIGQAKALPVISEMSIKCNERLTSFTKAMNIMSTVESIL